MKWRQARHDALIDDLVQAWNEYPDGFRGTLMLEWHDLYFAVSRLVRTVETDRRS